MSDPVEVDQYGNPIDGSRTIYCCYPDCGCDGARDINDPREDIGDESHHSVLRGGDC